MVNEKLTDTFITVENVFSSTKCTKGVVESDLVRWAAMARLKSSTSSLGNIHKTVNFKINLN